MIETVTALVALCTVIQLAMTDPDHAWGTGRSWAFPVKETITDAQLLANKPSCCYYGQVNGVILRSSNKHVYLRKGVPVTQP